jgi:ATP-binding cassette subfamily B protein
VGEGDDVDITRRGLRLMRRYIVGQRGPFSIAVLGATIFAISAVGTTVILGIVTDTLIIPAFEEGRDRDALIGAVVALLCVAFLRAASIVLRRYFGAMTGRRTQAGLRRAVTDRYLDTPLEFHQRTPTGQLLAHADADVEAATEVIYPLPFSIGVVVLIVFSVVSLALVDVWLVLVALVLFPTLAFLNRIYTSKVEEPSTVVQHNVGRVSTVAHESIDGALVVKTLGREQSEVERLGVEADALRRARIRVGRLRASFEPAIDAFPNVGIVALLALGAWEISTARISTGDLVQAMALFGVLAFPMRVLGFFFEELPRSVVSIDRIDGVLAEPTIRTASAADASTPAGPLSLIFENVSFGYATAAPSGEVLEEPAEPTSGGQVVLDGLTFEVAAGEVVALVGSTGAGKSTIANLAGYLVAPDSGVIRLGGVDMSTIDPVELRLVVATVFQDSFLFADSIAVNIGLDGDVDLDELRDAARVARADQFIVETDKGYDTVVGERGVTLSGGQRQRVALARALIRRPQLLILDDATSAVDPTVEAEILQGLRETLATTTLLVAQRVSSIELADRVLYLAGGRVAASGTHDELLATTPGYEAIVRAYEAASS